MQITKAVITAAGRGARQYPASDTVQKAMLPLVDRDGLTKPVLQIIAEEALESGIEEICVVSAPGDEAVYRDHFRNYAANLRSTYKGRRVGRGTGPPPRRARTTPALRRPAPSPKATDTRSGAPQRSSAVSRSCCCWATTFIFPSEPRRCARQLIDLASAENCAVSAVQATREHLIHQYGTAHGPAAARAP